MFDVSSNVTSMFVSELKYDGAVILSWNVPPRQCDETSVIFPSPRRRKRFSKDDRRNSFSSSILYLAPDWRFERHGIRVWSLAAFSFVHLSIDRSRQWDWQRCVNYLIPLFYLRIERLRTFAQESNKNAIFTWNSWRFVRSHFYSIVEVDSFD